MAALLSQSFQLTLFSQSKGNARRSGAVVATALSTYLPAKATKHKSHSTMS
jgi:hypothetical protein